MTDAKLTSQEAGALRKVLATLVVRDRTGEVGIIHGAERFVSTQLCLRKADRELLDAAAAKVGLSSVVSLKLCS